MTEFEKLYELWKAETAWPHRKSRFQDLLVYKRKQKKSWKTLGASDEQARELDKFHKRIK